MVKKLDAIKIYEIAESGNTVALTIIAIISTTNKYSSDNEKKELSFPLSLSLDKNFCGWFWSLECSAL